VRPCRLEHLLSHTLDSLVTSHKKKEEKPGKPTQPPNLLGFSGSRWVSGSPKDIRSSSFASSPHCVSSVNLRSLWHNQHTHAHTLSPSWRCDMCLLCKDCQKGEGRKHTQTDTKKANEEVESTREPRVDSFGSNAVNASLARTLQPKPNQPRPLFHPHPLFRVLHHITPIHHSTIPPSTQLECLSYSVFEVV